MVRAGILVALLLLSALVHSAPAGYQFLSSSYSVSTKAFFNAEYVISFTLPNALVGTQLYFDVSFSKSIALANSITTTFSNGVDSQSLSGGELTFSVTSVYSGLTTLQVVVPVTQFNVRASDVRSASVYVYSVVQTPSPTNSPTNAPTNSPTQFPTNAPIMSGSPTRVPTAAPTTAAGAVDTNGTQGKTNSSGSTGLSSLVVGMLYVLAIVVVGAGIMLYRESQRRKRMSQSASAAGSLRSSRRSAQVSVSINEETKLLPERKGSASKSGEGDAVPIEGETPAARKHMFSRPAMPKFLSFKKSGEAGAAAPAAVAPVVAAKPVENESKEAPEPPSARNSEVPASKPTPPKPVAPAPSKPAAPAVSKPSAPAPAPAASNSAPGSPAKQARPAPPKLPPPPRNVDALSPARPSKTESSEEVPPSGGVKAALAKFAGGDNAAPASNNRPRPPLPAFKKK
jgi:hypothetical protein